MSYAGMTRGDFFSRASGLVHLYDGTHIINDDGDYVLFQTDEIARIIDEQVRLGAESFLWIVSIILDSNPGGLLHATGQYRGKDGNYVDVLFGSTYGVDDGVGGNDLVAGVVPLSSWMLEREGGVDDPRDFYIRLYLNSDDSFYEKHIATAAIFGGYFEEPYREIL